MDLTSCHDDLKSMLVLKELVDPNIYRIIVSTMKFAKTLSQICEESELPISSTYKRIQKYGSIKNLKTLKLIEHSNENILVERANRKDEKGTTLYCHHSC